MSEHIVPIKTYVMVFLALMAGTAITVWVSLVDLTWFPGANLVIALIIASIKATLVILFFMHARYSPRLTWAVVIAGLFWLGLMMVGVMNDYAFRGWLTYPSQ
ncbi:MAG: cytochrome C oxidase subunit IV family protein [Acidobacteriota bacterium]|nr:cytochrome C oxidase subunit IV family protein [Acidobacteriota bacterium]